MCHNERIQYNRIMKLYKNEGINNKLSVVWITIKLQLKRRYLQKRSICNKEPIQYLVSEYDMRVRQTIRITNTKFYQNTVVKLRVVKESIRVIDDVSTKNKYAAKKLEESYKIYNIKVKKYINY